MTNVFSLVAPIVLGIASSALVLAQKTITASGSTGSAATVAKLRAVGTMNVTQFDQSGISVLPHSSESIAAAPADAALPKLLAILPYSVVVKNGSEKSIIAYTVSWATKVEGASPYTWYRTVRATEDSNSQIPPNSAKLITPDVQSSDDAMKYVQRFRHSALTVTLEAVMFEDGGTAGRDGSQSMAQVKADIKAEHDLFKLLLSEDHNLVISRLESMAKRDNSEDSLDLSNPFSAWYQFNQAQLARVLLRAAATSGVSGMLADVQKTFQGKQYPTTINSWGDR